jgi:hypothetical protein
MMFAPVNGSAPGWVVSAVGCSVVVGVQSSPGSLHVVVVVAQSSPGSLHVVVAQSSPGSLHVVVVAQSSPGSLHVVVAQSSPGSLHLVVAGVQSSPACSQVRRVRSRRSDLWCRGAAEWCDAPL